MHTKELYNILKTYCYVGQTHQKVGDLFDKEAIALLIVICYLLGSDRQIVYRDKQILHYVDAVILETMRKSNQLPVLQPRTVSADLFVEDKVCSLWPICPNSAYINLFYVIKYTCQLQR